VRRRRLASTVIFAAMVCHLPRRASSSPCWRLVFSGATRPPPRSTLFPYTTLFRSPNSTSESTSLAGEGVPGPVGALAGGRVRGETVLAVGILTRGTASLSSVGSGVRAPASQTCGGPAFEEIHELLEQPGDDEVDDESDGEGEMRVIRRLAQLVDLLGEVLESDERDHGRALEQLDEQRRERGDHQGPGLREEDSDHASGGGEAERDRTFPLALVDGDDRRPDDLGGIGAVVERQGADAADHRIEIDSEEREDVEEPEQLDQQRSAAEELDDDPGRNPQPGVGRRHRQAEDERDDDGADAAEDGEDDRCLNSLPQLWEEVQQRLDV